MISEVHICLCFSLSSTLAPRKRLHPDKNMLQEYTTLLLTIAINMKPYGKLKQYALLIVCESLTAEDEMVPGMGEYRANQIYKNKIKITSRNTVAKLLSLVFGQLANLSIHSTTGSSVISVHRKNSIHSTTGSLVISVHKKHTLYHWQYCYNYICTQKTYTPPLAILLYLYTENIIHSTTGSIDRSVRRKHIIHSTTATGSTVLSVHRKHITHCQCCYTCTQKTHHTLHHWQCCYICTQKTTTGWWWQCVGATGKPQHTSHPCQYCKRRFFFLFFPNWPACDWGVTRYMSVVIADSTVSSLPLKHRTRPPVSRIETLTGIFSTVHF